MSAHSCECKFSSFQSRTRDGFQSLSKRKTSGLYQDQGKYPHSLFIRTCDRRNRGSLDWVRLRVAFKKAYLCVHGDNNVLNVQCMYVYGCVCVCVCLPNPLLGKGKVDGRRKIRLPPFCIVRRPAPVYAGHLKLPPLLAQRFPCVVDFHKSTTQERHFSFPKWKDNLPFGGIVGGNAHNLWIERFHD